MDPIIFLILCPIIVIGFFIWWRIARKQRIESDKYKQALAEYERQQKEGQARSFMGRIHDLVWVDLLDLCKRHKKTTSTNHLNGFSFTVHSCSEELGWFRQPGEAVPCWLDIVDKEIRRRIEELLRNGDLKEVQNLALSRDLDQAWAAIGTTSEGVAWLEAGLRSTNPRQRARCHSTLYDGE